MRPAQVPVARRSRHGRETRSIRYPAPDVEYRLFQRKFYVSTFEIRGEANLSTIVLTEADDGREVDAGLNDVVVVSLPENPTTGYLWAVASETTGTLRLENSDFSAVAGTGVGGGGLRTFSFRAAAAGRAILELVCRRPWETDGSAVARYRLVINAG